MVLNNIEFHNNVEILPPSGTLCSDLLICTLETPLEKGLKGPHLESPAFQHQIWNNQTVLDLS